MAITNARMQVRRGLEKDFNPDEMTPGEWALSTDTKYIRMCIYPGLCLRMATYESFEQDMVQIQIILTEAKSIQEAVMRINTEVSANAKAVAEYTSQAEQYRDEASASATSAKEDAERAELAAKNAEAVSGVGMATETVAGLMSGGDNAVSEDGTLMLTKVTTDRTLEKSKEGGLKINRVDGESQQNGTPTPDAPIEIDSVVLSEIKSVGKNLWSHGDASGTLSVSVGVSGEIKAGTYTISALVKSSDTDSARSIVGYTYGDGSASKYIYFNRNERQSKTVTFEKDVVTMVFYASETYNLSTGDTFTWSDIQIEEGSTATPYEPYHESTIQLSNPITLRGIGDVKDGIVKRDGVYEVLRNVGRFILSSDLNYVLSGYGYFFTNVDIIPPTSETVWYSIISSHFMPGNPYNNEGDLLGLLSYQNKAEIRFSGSMASTVAELKTWLSENTVEVYYPLATPTFEPLPLVDQIALHQSETFDTVTYISTDSTIEPVIEVEYGTSVVGGYALKHENEQYKAQSTIKNTVKDWTFDKKTGIATVTKVNGDTTEYDTMTVDVLTKQLGEWGILDTGITEKVLNVSYANGRYIISTVGGYIYHSTDCVEWTKKLVYATTYYGIQKVVYGNGIYVAIFNTTIMFYSTDLITWRSANYSKRVSGIIFADNKFVVCGTGFVASSEDGKTWNEFTVGDGTGGFHRIAYGNGIYVLPNGGGTRQLLYSEDLITWTPAEIVAPTTGYFSKIIYAEGKFVAPVSGDNLVFYSEDGISWVTSTHDYAGYYVNDIAYGNGLFIMSDNQSYIHTSADAITWNSMKIDSENALSLGFITYGGGKFITGISNSTSPMYFSEFEKETTNITESIKDLYFKVNRMPYALVPIPSANWTESTEYTGYGYVFEQSIEDYYDVFPEWFLKPLSGIVPTEAEQTAFENIAAMKLDISDTSSPKLKFYAATQPTTDILVLVKGVQ